MGCSCKVQALSYPIHTCVVQCSPLLHFVKLTVRLISSEYLGFSASGGPLGGHPEPPSKLLQSILLNVDALAGIAKPGRVSVSISIDTLMNAEARAGFAPKGL